jgi:hypothetical protein
MSNFVFLIDANKTPMNPIHPAQAKKLLNSGKAAVFRRLPFVLIMNRVIENIVTYTIDLKIDTGSKFTGISLVNNRDEVIWGMELQHRGAVIKGELETRRGIRRSSRNCHTRYRRVLTTNTWVKRLIKYAPIAAITQELVRFDLQQLENPEISGMGFGPMAAADIKISA